LTNSICTGSVYTCGGFCCYDINILVSVQVHTYANTHWTYTYTLYTYHVLYMYLYSLCHCYCRRKYSHPVIYSNVLEPDTYTFSIFMLSSYSKYKLIQRDSIG